MQLLLILLAVFLLTAAWPLWKWRGARQHAVGRERDEDALKHLFEQQYRGGQGSVASLAGALRLHGAPLLGVLARLERRGLVSMKGQEAALTPEGERTALQVIRAHRVLERYFADEARLPIRDVHRAAERREHTVSAEEVDRLAAAMGHPSFDPHGDPIPAADGSVPPATGQPATSWPTGTPGQIVHLEDEPPVAFAQIVAQGLRTGQTLRIVDRTPDGITLSDGGREFRLDPAVASNVFLAAAPAHAVTPGVSRLADLPNDAEAEIVGLDEACQGFSRRRLMDLGFTEGSGIRPVLDTFAGDPRAYRIRGTTVALRRDQASLVLVRRADTVDGTASAGAA